MTRDYINITQKDLREFLHSHLAWQLKRPTRHDSKDRSYIYHTKPGFLEIDYTFRDVKTKDVNGNRNYLLTCVDRFSRYAWVIARSSKDSRGTSTSFKTICEDFKRLTGQYPYAVLHDSGLEFKNRVFSKYCKTIHCKQHLTEPYRPATMIERFNRTLRENVDRFLHMYSTERYLDYLPKFLK